MSVGMVVMQVSGDEDVMGGMAKVLECFHDWLQVQTPPSSRPASQTHPHPNTS